MRATDWTAAEDARIHAHLRGALAVLRAGNTAPMEAPARDARARHMAELERYVARGVYPRNVARGGPLVPALIDPWGTRCALAHLIEESGERPLVNRLRGLDNHARVRDLSGDRGLVDWLHRAGLTVAEAARIQPSYHPRPTAFECACHGLREGAALGRLTMVAPAEGHKARCRVLVEELLTPKPSAETGLSVGAEVDAVCPTNVMRGGKVVVVYEAARATDPFGDGLTAYVVGSDAVMYSADCEVGAARGRKEPPAKITLAALRDAARHEPAACMALVQGLPYQPPPPRPAPKPALTATAAPTIAPSAREFPRSAQESPRSGEEPGNSEEKPAPPIETPFPQPVHYLAGAGALFVAGAAAYVVVRRRR